MSRATYDSLLESSPTLDQDVIATFNKKFNDDYPNVSKPIVCNGLREIKVYSQSQHTEHDVVVDTEENNDETEQIAEQQ